MTTMTPSRAAKIPPKNKVPTETAPEQARPMHMFPADLQKPLDPVAEPVYLNPIIAFYLFLAAHVVAALWFPIQDCDEVYNYYEPTHYLTDGYGKQTWEYSPDYAIRSWAYVTVHAFVVGLRRVIPVFGLPKVWKFYFLRIMLGAFCAFSEGITPLDAVMIPSPLRVRLYRTRSKGRNCGERLKSWIAGLYGFWGTKRGRV